MWQEKYSPTWPILDQNSGRRKEKREGKKRKGGKENVERASHILSKFLDDQTDGSQRSKKKSAFPRQELQMETGTGSFEKLQEVGVSLLLGLLLV